MMDIRETAQSLTDLALFHAPEEACGFIWKDWSFTTVPNVADNPETGFSMAEDSLLDAFSRYTEMLGVWHTHPRGTKTPSKHDREFPYPQLRYFIATPNDLYEWGFRDGKFYGVNIRTGEWGRPNLAIPFLGRTG